jgi:hypothetical protein
MKLAVILCLIFTQDDLPTWKYIGAAPHSEGDGSTHVYARDCDKFTDEESEKYRKLCVKVSSTRPARVKGRLDEYDCQRRLFRIRIAVFEDYEHELDDIPWQKATPTSIAERLMNYACRDKCKDKAER